MWVVTESKMEGVGEQTVPRVGFFQNRGF